MLVECDIRHQAAGMIERRDVMAFVSEGLQSRVAEVGDDDSALVTWKESGKYRRDRISVLFYVSEARASLTSTEQGQTTTVLFVCLFRVFGEAARAQRGLLLLFGLPLLASSRAVLWVPLFATCSPPPPNHHARASRVAPRVGDRCSGLSHLGSNRHQRRL